jgi:hypothetical protein
MTTSRITRALAALVVAGALGSCAAEAEPAASGDRGRKGKAAQVKGDHRKPGTKPGAAGSGKAKPASNRETGPGSNASAAAGATENKHGNTSTVTQPAARPSCTEDPSGDTDSAGAAPAYADLTGGCLRLDGSRVRLEADAGAPVPARMPDRDTQMSYGFELTRPDGSTAYAYAQADPGGWKAYLSRGQGRRQIAPPVVEGDRLTLFLPLSELGSAQRIQWALESSWLRSSLVSTSYAFDGSPDGGSARFDR